jgi:protein Tex
LEAKVLELISLGLGIKEQNVKNTLELLLDGATIPFISRYRKEKTGGMDEVQVGDIQKQYKKLMEIIERKESIITSIEEQGKLTPELKAKIMASFDPNEIEDLYLPYKRRKKTRADVARDLGLEPLAKAIMSQRNQDIDGQARRYINDKVPTIQDAIHGAQDIIAEWISEDQDIRERLRINFRKFAVLRSKVVTKKKDEAEKFQDYFDFQESISRCPSHRFLAVARGEQEGLLKVSLEVDEDRALQMIDKKYIRSHGYEADLIAAAIDDSFKRLIFPAVKTQIINEFKEKADEEAIRVFGENLRQLLLAAPLGQKAVVAIDPGFRTGCKVVALDANGDFLEYKTVFPHPPQNQSEEAKNIIRMMVDKHQAKAIAIGNGTASRETKSLVDAIRFDQKIDVYVVSESGASIYSASDVAREEFPDHDVTVRGAISIGRRLMDPLAELVKIDAKSIGVGQYQHDVHQGKLKENLDMTVVSCVNKVGVNLNTASNHILTYIAGLGPVLAKNIVQYRRENGDFKEIKELNKVPRLGSKAFEQAAGFLRIKNGHNLLDDTGVHPERYALVQQMAKTAGVGLDTFVKDKSARQRIDLNSFISDDVGLPTLTDIMKELDKPGLDPRGEAKQFSFDENIRSIEDVREGMVIPGIITNMTNFGAFVDIGAKQDALLHISQITKKFIQNPAEVLHLGQELRVSVLSVDAPRKRINLTLLF